ncbi:MAG: hypothetical protein AUJ55_11500 [Proteobacteria bacterium CG1_02_64_396]|nr:MAG: hypothetical protein AUJ55_11500 [Proteobacteria bacterium CG1_02_64_396]
MGTKGLVDEEYVVRYLGFGSTMLRIMRKKGEGRQLNVNLGESWAGGWFVAHLCGKDVGLACDELEWSGL